MKLHTLIPVFLMILGSFGLNGVWSQSYQHNQLRNIAIFTLDRTKRNLA